MNAAFTWQDAYGNSTYRLDNGYQATGCRLCGIVVPNYDNAMRYSPSGKAYCEECCRKNAGSEAAKLDSLCPPGYAHATFESLPPRQQKFLRGWPDTTKFMVIGGIPGSGKTFAAWALEKILAAKGLRCSVYNCLDLRARWVASDNRDKITEGARQARFLILDGLTDGAATDGWAQEIQRLLDYRMGENLPTLITTMDRPERIETLWGRHILSRLNAFAWTILPAKDLRQHARICVPEAL